MEIEFEWVLLLTRWAHITVAVTWIGTSIFFMWLDRSFQNGELWMVHGGGFYQVKKLDMATTPVPKHLHWFKWESYWTWMTGALLLALMFYTGDGALLLDSSISTISFYPAVTIAVVSVIGSWFVYDFLWESSLVKKTPYIGHTLTLLWFGGMSYYLCHTFSGRGAYMHLAAILGTWMTGNVFLRIIPRQIKMVEARKQNQPIQSDWSKNAKARSTHNTYFTLPIIFIMISNHFPSTYGHSLSWLVLLLVTAAGAAIRHYFVTRIQSPFEAKGFLTLGFALLVAVILITKETL